MVKVRFKEALFAEQTNTHYLKGAEVRLPNDLAERHGENGTGLLELIEDDGSPDPPVEIQPVTVATPTVKKKKPSAK
jgi:hypothetical protein